MAFFPGPMPQKGTHVRLGLGTSCPGPSVLLRKPGSSVKRREALPHTRLGVWLRRAQVVGRTCSKPTLNCVDSTMPVSRVKPNSSKITQDGLCGTSLSLAQYTGCQCRLRLEKRGWGGAERRLKLGIPDAIYHPPQMGPIVSSAPSPWQEGPDLQSRGVVGMEILCHLENPWSKEDYLSGRVTRAVFPQLIRAKCLLFGEHLEGVD